MNNTIITQHQIKIFVTLSFVWGMISSIFVVVVLGKFFDWIAPSLATISILTIVFWIPLYFLFWMLHTYITKRLSENTSKQQDEIFLSRTKGFKILLKLYLFIFVLLLILITIFSEMQVALRHS